MGEKKMLFLVVIFFVVIMITIPLLIHLTYNIGYSHARQDAWNEGYQEGYSEIMNMTLVDNFNYTMMVFGNTTSLENATAEGSYSFNVTFENNCRVEKGIFTGGYQVIYRNCWAKQNLTPMILIDCPVTETYQGINLKPFFGENR